MTAPNDDYLWDRSGEPDPLTANLERRLAPLRYRARKPRSFLSPRALAALAAAAFLTALPFALLRAARSDELYPVLLLEGAARIVPPGGGDGAPLVPHEQRMVPAGSVLASAAESRTRVQVADLGDVLVEGAAEVRLERTSEKLHRLFLQEGRMRASISARARPRVFQVGTPAGTAVDLGCEYSMQVRPDGWTELRVWLGRVAFEIGKRAVYVRAGALCYADPKRGVGTPFEESAPKEVADAVRAFDAGDAGALAPLLRHARPEDALSLWHLLGSVEATSRPAVYERLAELAPPPQGAAREACLRGDADALESWRIEIMGW